ncbi:MAG TPA: EamA family transporter [Gaiellaceae bacterium]|nr:EamA family transporter [Gaiellaceae bacterium]
MPASAFALALGAAVVHALWNLLLARARDPEAATAVALLVGVVVFAPAAALAWEVESRVWPYLAVTSALELLYIALLGAAYRRAELSVVYPLGRGLAPLLVLGVGVLALGAETTAVQATGVCLVGLGVLLVRGLHRPAAPAGVVFGLAIACSIAAYTLVDDEGIRYANALTYVELALVLPALTYAGGIVALRGAPALRAELRPATLFAGVGMLGSYALALAALARADAAPVAAVRETSIVFAAAGAALLLRERVGPARLAGAVLVAAGVALLGA